MSDQDTRTGGVGGAGGAGPSGGQAEVRVTDKRRIDPATGHVREPAPAEVPAEAGGTAAPTAEPPSQAPEPDPLAQAQAQAADLLDQLQRRTADHYNLEQEYSAYVKRSRAELAAARRQGAADVAEALVGVLDDIELARAHGDLSGPFAAIADKLEQTLQRFGVERYGAPSEPFDPAVHEALLHSTSPDVTEPTVQQVLQPGYRAGDRILRAARVAVVGPQG